MITKPLYRVQHVWCEPGQDHHSEYTVLTMKHSDGSVGEMIFKFILEILQKLSRKGIFQHDNHLKHTVKVTQETPLGYFKGKATQPLQQNQLKKTE
uniref:Uncharacterized protein n=1 Tax=Amphiprion percula TaxID=161767 RepID=A0A3P8SJG5_AMPPE